jgi:IclR family acetate operon transcriptional repressor
MLASPGPVSGRRRPVGTIDRALAVLEALADRGEPMGITELAARIGLPKSVVHYHLSALTRNRYVISRDGRYGLGYAAAKLGTNAYAHSDLRGRANPIMTTLREASEETVTLSSLLGRERIYVDQLVSPHEIKMSVELGRPYPLHAGASGKAMLAFLPAPLRESILASVLGRLTDRTITDRHALESELVMVRELGTAASRGERQTGAASVAAPIFDGQMVIGSMSVCGPEYRFDDAAVTRYRILVKNAAAQISNDLSRR